MKRFCLTLLVVVATCAANPLLDAATANLDEIHARIKAIDESPFFERLMSFAERRRLSHEVSYMGTLNRIASSMSLMFNRIAIENITSATEVIDTLKQEYCIGAAPNMDTVANVSSYIITGIGSGFDSVGLTPAMIGYDAIISKFLTGCLCTSTWKLDQPEVTALWTSVVGLMKYNPADARTNLDKRKDLIAKVQAAAPILAGPTSFCADSCRTSIVAIFDMLFALVPKIVLSPSVSSSGGQSLGKWGPGKDTGIPTSIALPANSAAQAKLGGDLYGCLCSGWDWGALAEAAFQVPWYMIFGGSIYSAWSGIGEGTIAGGSPWVGASYASSAASAGMPNTASDPALVINTATTNIAIIRSSLCAAGCLSFLTDFLTLGMHTAAEYYWPSLVKGLISSATAAQIPSEEKIASAFEALPNCMCNMNLTLAKETLYPKLSYLLTGAKNPYPNDIAVISNLTYSGSSAAFCTVSNCSGFLGSFAKLFTPAAELALSTPGAILSGKFYSMGGGSSTLLAEDPPIVSPGTLTSAQMDIFFDNLMPCMCHHADPAIGARDLITWAADAMFNNRSFTAKSLQPNFAQGLQPFIQKAIQGSKYCGANSCRKVVQVLKEHMSSMLTTEPEGTCTAANAAKCRGMSSSTTTSKSFEEVCSAPQFGAKASQKFPLRWLDMTTFNSVPTEALSIDDGFVYWELCSVVTECPLGSANVYEIKITFTIDATVETFDETDFKLKLAAFLNADAADAQGSVTVNDITLKVTAGSITVEASINAYTQSVKNAIVQSLDAATTDTLGAALGVKVLSKSSVEVVEKSTLPDGTMKQTASNGGALTVGAIVGIIVGAVVFLVVLGGLIALCIWKKKKQKQDAASNAAKDVQFTTSTDGEAATTADDSKI